MPIFIELQLVAKEEAAQVQLLANQLRRIFPCATRRAGRTNNNDATSVETEDRQRSEPDNRLSSGTPQSIAQSSELQAGQPASANRSNRRPASAYSGDLGNSRCCRLRLLASKFHPAQQREQKEVQGNIDHRAGQHHQPEALGGREA